MLPTRLYLSGQFHLQLFILVRLLLCAPQGLFIFFFQFFVGSQQIIKLQLLLLQLFHTLISHFLVVLLILELTLEVRLSRFEYVQLGCLFQNVLFLFCSFQFMLIYQFTFCFIVLLELCQLAL